jgi:hypothetical protein
MKAPKMSIPIVKGRTKRVNMLRQRLVAIEKRLIDLAGPPEKKCRIVILHDGDPEPQACPHPDEDLIILRIVNTRAQNLAKREEQKSEPSANETKPEDPKSHCGENGNPRQ